MDERELHPHSRSAASRGHTRHYSEGNLGRVGSFDKGKAYAERVKEYMMGASLKKRAAAGFVQEQRKTKVEHAKALREITQERENTIPDSENFTIENASAMQERSGEIYPEEDESRNTHLTSEIVHNFVSGRGARKGSAATISKDLVDKISFKHQRNDSGGTTKRKEYLQKLKQKNNSITRAATAMGKHSQSRSQYIGNGKVLENGSETFRGTQKKKNNPLVQGAPPVASGAPGPGTSRDFS